MAMKKCKECKSPVSTKAATCPSCGAPTKKKPNTLAGCLVFFLLFGGCIFWFGNISVDAIRKIEIPEAKPWDETEDPIMAYVMIEDFVENRLKSPSSATFPGVFDGPLDHVEVLDNHRYRIVSWVDAENSFGAKIRTRFVGVIQQTTKDDWKLESLELLE